MPKHLKEVNMNVQVQSRFVSHVPHYVSAETFLSSIYALIQGEKLFKTLSPNITIDFFQN